MKKLTTVLIAAGLLATASACSAPQLTTAETCDRVGVAVSSLSSNSGKTATARVANAVRPIESVASDEMKSVVTAIVDYSDEASKANPDENKMGTLSAAYQAAGTKYGQLCAAK
ncbi:MULTISPECIES: hypothetical protein [unclassified Arthrobacter]|uniref:hypothetical protein n=1 Tax=unclassified Arthrobacter TaxID=235627 RepID=UPI00254A993D|nr:MULTISPECIES: hypothetical protein [unclassified Arthrobacter]